MYSRISKSELRPGDYNIETGEKSPVLLGLHLLSADWGTIEVHVSSQSANWYPRFNSFPDWDQIESWLKIVADSISSDHKLQIDNFVDVCLRHLMANYSSS